MDFFCLSITFWICAGISGVRPRVSSTTSKNFTGWAVSKKIP
ncbi:hypothetical protein [Flagellimonas myxillae]